MTGVGFSFLETRLIQAEDDEEWVSEHYGVSAVRV